MTCKQVTSLIAAYLAGKLDPETTLVFEKHLIDCPDCISFLNTYKKTFHAARSLKYKDIPSGMKRRVRQFLRVKAKGFPRSR